jgi:hypothetical protein
MLRSSATSYYRADGLGSIKSLSNSAGALAQTYTFDAFGKQTNSSGSLTNPHRYTARRRTPKPACSTTAPDTTIPAQDGS